MRPRGSQKQKRRCCQRRSGATTRVSQRVLVHRDRPTSTGTGGSDPLWHSWRGTPARDPWKTLRVSADCPLIYRKRCKGKAGPSGKGSFPRRGGQRPLIDPGLPPVLAAGASLVPTWLRLSRPVRLASRFRFVEGFEVCPGIRHVGTTLTAGVGVAELAAPFACPVLDNLVVAVPHKCGVGLAAHFFPRQLISHALAQ